MCFVGDSQRSLHLRDELHQGGVGHAQPPHQLDRAKDQHLG